MPTLSSHTHLQAAQISAQPKLTNKYACPPHNDRQESTGGNTGLAKVAVQSSADTFVGNQTLVLRIKICGENRHLRQARKRCETYAPPGSRAE